MTSAVAVTPEDPHRKPVQSIHIGVVHINYKRTKEEASIIKEEMIRLHEYVNQNKQIDWAKQRIERLQELILSPDASTIRSQLSKAIPQQDE